MHRKVKRNVSLSNDNDYLAPYTFQSESHILHEASKLRNYFVLLQLITCITKNTRPNTDVFVKVSTTVCLFSEVTDVVKFFHSVSINQKLITIYFPRMTTRNDNDKTRFLSVM